MIKMVVTDMDGTLLDSQKRLPEGFEEVYRKLIERGIYFVIASGRQYYTLVEEFRHLKHSMSFIAENGGFIKWNGSVHLLRSMKMHNVKTLIEQIRTIEGADIVLCGRNGAYVESGSEQFLKEAQKYYYRCEVVDDLLDVKDDILKLAVNDFQHLESKTLGLVRIYAKDFHVSTSSAIWLDIMPKGVDKGEGVEYLQKQLGVLSEETMVFGDYLNDLEMLQKARYSYAMANAHEDIKKIARYQTKSNDEDGVLMVLKELLKE